MVEFVVIVDDDDNIIRKASRDESADKMLRRRSSKVIVQDGSGKLLIHKRAAGKRMYPGCWDIGISETVTWGEEYLDAAVRGLKEELGIVTGPSKLKLLSAYKYTDDIARRYYMIYGFAYEGSIKYDPYEIEEYEFLTMTELKKAIELRDFIPLSTEILKLI